MSRGRLRNRPRFVDDVVEIVGGSAFADDVEQIAMLARGRIDPFAGRALPLRRLQPHEHGSARRVADVADEPVGALAATVGQIVAAHRLGISARDGAPVRMLNRTSAALQDQRDPPLLAGPSRVGLWEATRRRCREGRPPRHPQLRPRATISSIAVSLSIAAVSSIAALRPDGSESRLRRTMRRVAGRAQRLGQPSRAGEQMLRLRGHLAFLERLDAARVLLAARLADGVEDARLGHAAEEIVDARRPARRGDVERERLGETIGVGDRPAAVGSRPR